MAAQGPQERIAAAIRKSWTAGRRAIWFRSSPWPTVAIFTVIAAATAMLWVSFDTFYRSRIEQQHIEQTERIAASEQLARSWPEGASALSEVLRELSGVIGARLTAYDAEGALLASSQSTSVPIPPDGMAEGVRAALAGEVGTSRGANPSGEPIYIAAAPVRDGGTIVGAIQAAYPQAELETSIALARNRLLAGSLIAASLLLAILMYVASRASHSLRKLTEMTERITGGDLDARVLLLRRDEIGRLASALNVMADKLQRQMKKRAREKDRLNTVLHVMTDGVIILDPMGDVRLINPAAARMLRTSGANALRRSFVQATRDHRIVEVWTRCRDEGAEQSATVEMPTGQFVRIIVTPLLKHSRSGYLVLLQDLTQVRRLQTVRQDFVSNVSHELRTPLASLHALVETLRDGAIDDPPAAARFLDRMEVELDALTQMVEELLELSRIESGRAPLQTKPVSVRDAVMPAVDRLRPQAERNNITLDIQIPNDLPQVLVDLQRMHQVVTNIVHNAIKFSPGGGNVLIQAEAKPSCVEVTVRDTGIGIPREDLPRVFERFYKTDRSRALGGTGLGLAIVKHIVQAHGGRIWAESVEGEGSLFGFTLPIADEPQPTANDMPQASQAAQESQ